jgi:hypothetical protein
MRDYVDWIQLAQDDILLLYSFQHSNELLDSING